MLGILGVLLLGSGALLLFVVVPRYVESKVLSAAEAEGVHLKPEDIAFGWGWVQLTQVQVSLDRVRPVEMQVGRIDVALDGLTPLSIELSNVEGLVTGSITNIGLELSEWTRAHASAYALPLSAKNVHVRFVEPAGTPPWLELSGGQLTRTATGGVFAAQRCRFLDVDLGKVGASFARESSAIALGFGESELSRAPFRVEVSANGKTPTATFTLAPTPAEKLSRPLGMSLPVTGVIVSSQTTITFAEGESSGAINGTTHITLKGYVPPHPFELDGFIFGDTTSFDTRFALPPTRDRITLSDSKLEAGKFQLAGEGLLIRASDHSEATLSLKGALPCSALASVEAESRLAKILGGELARRSGKIAEKLVNGSVAIGLKLTADTRNLLAARVDRTIGVGCGLRPLTLEELSRLVPLPADVALLLQNLPALSGAISQLPGLQGLPTALPPLPSSLPALPAGLPQLPNFGLPTSAPAAPAPAASAKTGPKKASGKALPAPAASGR